MAEAIPFAASVARHFAGRIRSTRVDIVQHWNFWSSVAIGGGAPARDWNSHGAGGGRKGYDQAGHKGRNAPCDDRTGGGDYRCAVPDAHNFGIALWSVGG